MLMAFQSCSAFTGRCASPAPACEQCRLCPQHCIATVCAHCTARQCDLQVWKAQRFTTRCKPVWSERESVIRDSGTFFFVACCLWLCGEMMLARDAQTARTTLTVKKEQQEKSRNNVSPFFFFFIFVNTKDALNSQRRFKNTSRV